MWVNYLFKIIASIDSKFYSVKINILTSLKPFIKCLLDAVSVKVPLLWVMKGSYFGFGSPQQQVDMHARSKNTLIFL